MAGVAAHRDGANSTNHTAHPLDIVEEPEDFSGENAWSSQNLLSLDGGGIRGYWSLLALDQLMKHVADEERKIGNDHSFIPEEWPENVSQIPHTESEQRDHDNATTAEAKRCVIPRSRRYLPCHYFDYICGSSTGAFVTALATESSEEVATTYLIRSYDHNLRKIKPNQLRQPRRGTTMTTNRSNTDRSGGAVSELPERTKLSKSINYENAQEFEIWEVARAATAAPFYFEQLKIERPASRKHMLFTDGGFDYTNNPTKEGIREIREAYGIQATGAVISIGTARRDEPSRRKGLFPIISRVKGIVNKATDPEGVHRDVQRDSEREGAEFWYRRLNDAGALKIDLDEWKPKNHRFSRSGAALAGSETIDTITNSFNKWYREHGVGLLQGCAEELVARRVARTENAEKWEQYATNAQYKCHYVGCEAKFISQSGFRDHLVHTHNVPQDTLDAEVRECRKQWHYRKPIPRSR
ncbi:hypothetical protein MMC11_001685 [Xylographa trunciseda]|nr:hypothetical protein [Xylographa trunciseda]